MSGFGSYTIAERAAIRAGLDQFESVLNVQFVEQSAEQSAEQTIDLSFLKSSEGVSGGRGRFQWTSSPYEYDAFILFNNNRDMAQSFNTSLMLHEIAHALSLKHPGNYDVNPLNAPPGPYLPEDEDNNRFTLMSYTPNPETGQEADSLMRYDITALQERWGANLTTRTGNTTYTAPAAGDLEAIWDADGYDMISAAGTSADTVIDLRQAHFSGFGGIDRLVVGYDVVIEAGEGGAGHDILQRNAVANRLMGGGGDDQINGNGGNDWMIGNTGRDTLVGGVGADTFVYTSISESRSGSASRDLINGFDRGSDRIDLSAIDANLGGPGEGAFTFIGTAQFSGAAGELRLQGLGGPNAVLVEGDVRGDGVADLQNFVNLRRALDADDFIL